MKTIYFETNSVFYKISRKNARRATLTCHFNSILQFFFFFIYMLSQQL
jgi:hypothetical protein